MIKLSNFNRGLVEAVIALFESGNKDPHKQEIAAAVAYGPGAPANLRISPYIEAIVRRGLPTIRYYLREQGLKQVVTVGPFYYAKPDPDLALGGCDRKLPKTLPEARLCLARAGQPIEGIVLSNGANGKNFLWQAQLFYDHKSHLVAALNYRAQLQTYVERKWLKAGELDSLQVSDIERLLTQ